MTAVRSPGDSPGSAAAAVVEGGEEELREAFDAAAGEEGLLGLDGFRVSRAVCGCLSGFHRRRHCYRHALGFTAEVSSR